MQLIKRRCCKLTILSSLTFSLLTSLSEILAFLCLLTYLQTLYSLSIRSTCLFLEIICDQKDYYAYRGTEFCFCELELVLRAQLCKLTTLLLLNYITNSWISNILTYVLLADHALRASSVGGALTLAFCKENHINGYNLFMQCDH